ncbi:MAG: hypothetical protein V3U89_07945 [Methylophilaceae bacterium]
MPISFKLPELESNPILLAETRASKLNEFVRNLPFSDPMKAAADLSEELQILNSQKTSYSNRLNALEIYRPAAIQITQALIPLFSYSKLPISKNQKGYADAASQVWEEMAFGYKWALIDLQNKIININSDKSAALVIQRAIHALKETAFISYLTYRAPARSLWAELHQLYYCALQQNAQALIVNESLTDDNQSSVDSVYKELLLLALAHPQRLSGQELVRTSAYLTKIADDVELSTVGHVESSTGVFLIELDGNKPPTAYARNIDTPNTETDLLMITVKLAKRIHTHLRLLKDDILPNDGSLPSNAVNSHYQDLLKHLITHIGKSPIRAFSRAKKNDGMELGIGIHDAHYFSPKIGNDYKNLVVKSIAVKPSRWQILNVGAGGYALRKFNSSQASIQVGDIAVIKNNESLYWEIGVIRWASINELNQLDIGFELIAPSAMPVTIKVPKRKDKIIGLLLPEISALKQKTSFIIQRGECEPGETLAFANDGIRNKVVVTELIERTASFERYHYNLIEH